MDMYTSVTPPTVSFLKSSSFLSFTDRKSQASCNESSLSKPLIISSTVFDEENVATSTPPIKLYTASELRTSLTELPHDHQQCSYTQSVLNGNFAYIL